MVSWNEIREFFGSFGKEFMDLLQVGATWEYRILDRPDLVWHIVKGEDGLPQVIEGPAEKPDAILFYNEKTLEWIIKNTARDQNGRPIPEDFYRKWKEIHDHPRPGFDTYWELKVSLRKLKSKGYMEFAKKYGLLTE